MILINIGLSENVFELILSYCGSQNTFKIHFPIQLTSNFYWKSFKLLSKEHG
jgi:hypothetical protein